MTEEVVAAAIKAHGTERTGLLPVLQHVTSKEKWLSEEDLVRIARAFHEHAALSATQCPAWAALAP